MNSHYWKVLEQANEHPELWRPELSRPQSHYVPYVLERTPQGERGMDIWSRLMRSRIIFFSGEVHDHMADLIIAQLLFLEYEDPDGDIMLYVHSPGGAVDAGLAVYDTIQFIKPDVSTICMGMAASMGALILTAGTKGKRYSLPHARVMIHQVSAGVPFGQGTDVEIRAREILRYKVLLNEIMARHTGKSVDEVTRDTERDYFMSAQQALEYGLIDHIMSRETHEQQQQAQAEALR
jgi:ATP-dependent Clp protease, protease subunit